MATHRRSTAACPSPVPNAGPDAVVSAIVPHVDDALRSSLTKESQRLAGKADKARTAIRRAEARLAQGRAPAHVLAADAARIEALGAEVSSIERAVAALNSLISE